MGEDATSEGHPDTKVWFEINKEIMDMFGSLIKSWKKDPKKVPKEKAPNQQKMAEKSGKAAASASNSNDTRAQKAQTNDNTDASGKSVRRGHYRYPNCFGCTKVKRTDVYSKANGDSTVTVSVEMGKTDSTYYTHEK